MIQNLEVPKMGLKYLLLLSLEDSCNEDAGFIKLLKIFVCEILQAHTNQTAPKIPSAQICQYCQ